MKKNKKADTLEEVPACVGLVPLKGGSEQYVDLSEARDSNALAEVQIQLLDANSKQGQFAKIPFTGYRGCGKTTELNYLQNAVSDGLVSLYLPLPKNILRDCNFIDILISLVEIIIRRFSQRKWPINSTVVIGLSDWFALKCFDNPDEVKEEIRSEVGRDFQSEYGLYWMPVLLLNRIKSMMIASSMHRQTIRKKLTTYTSEMNYKINCFLDEARETLARVKKSQELLIVIDNLDHLPTEIARKLFFDSADIFHFLRVHLLFTFPVALRLPPYSITDHFHNCFHLPMVKLGDEKGAEFEPGLKGFREVVGRRLNLKKIFRSDKVLNHMIRMSGGNLRDLMVLINHAQLASRAAHAKLIDLECGEKSIQRLSDYYEKMLVPKEVFYPLLHTVNGTKREHFLVDKNRTADGVRDSRFFGDELMTIGAVLDNNNKSRIEIHPAVAQIQSYQEFVNEKSACNVGFFRTNGGKAT